MKNERLDLVLEVLKKRGGFRPMKKPLHVADIDYDFDFDAVLEGPHDQRSLVLLATAESTSASAIERLVRSFSTALRRTESTRPITLVLLLEKYDREYVLSLRQTCRVIVLLPNDLLDEALLALLPIQTPSSAQTIVAARAALLKALEDELDANSKDALITELLRAAATNHEAVQHSILAAFSQAATLPVKSKEQP